MLPRASTVSLYVDPCCPFAWIAYRWLLEVRRYQSIELRLDLMSLPILNEDQDISPQYRRLLERTWAPARARWPPGAAGPRSAVSSCGRGRRRSAERAGVR